MNAQELAEKFKAKSERRLSSGTARAELPERMFRSVAIEHCKRGMEANVIPFLGEGQFNFAPQIDIHDHKPVGCRSRSGTAEPRQSLPLSELSS
jgi:hypothetical protein